MTAFEFDHLPAGDSQDTEGAPPALEAPHFEVVQINGALEDSEHLPQGTGITISCSPTPGIENTLALAEESFSQDLRVIPHLAARLVTGKRRPTKIYENAEGWIFQDSSKQTKSGPEGLRHGEIRSDPIKPVQPGSL